MVHLTRGLKPDAHCHLQLKIMLDELIEKIKQDKTAWAP
jgi:hypothetical protein